MKSTLKNNRNYFSNRLPFGNTGQPVFLKKSKFVFCKKLIFLFVLNCFDTLISKIFLKKHYFDAFRHEKHFEKQPQPHSQTCRSN